MLFQPHKSRQLYSKQHLHPDEEPYFVSGPSCHGLLDQGEKVALAICYELSVPEHAALAIENGAKIYLASVAKTAAGVDKAMIRLAEIARVNSIFALMANSIGMADGGECDGRSAVWNHQGTLLTQLDRSNEGVIVVDTDTGLVSQRTIVA